MLVRAVRCIQGQVDVVLNCEPVFDYGRTDATWEYTGEGYEDAVAHGGPDDLPLHLTTNMRLGMEGRSAVAFTRLERRRHRVRGAALGRGGAPTADGPRTRRGRSIHETVGFLARLAQQG